MITSIKGLFENWKYGSDTRNANFDDLPFDSYQRLVTRQAINLVNDNIVESLNNSLIIK